MDEISDIRRTLETLVREKEELYARLQKIDAAIVSLSALTPGKTVNKGQTTLFEIEAPKIKGSLTKVIQDELSDRKSHDLDELADKLKARGFVFGSKSAKRAINFALQGLKNAKRVEPTANGWKLRV